jgi:hypothetical protein
MRQYLSEGVESWKMAAFVEVPPAMLHFSLLLFNMGLIAFLYEINVILVAVVSVVEAIGIIGYGILTFIPTQWSECPYQTPLTALCIILFSTVRSLWKSSRPNGSAPVAWLTLRGRRALVLKDSTDCDEIGIWGLKWLWAQLAEGREVTQFVRAIPQFLETFQTGRGGLVANRIILEASMNDILEPLDLYRVEEESTEDTVGVCLIAVISAARDTPDCTLTLDWAPYFPSDQPRSISRVTHTPRLAPLALYAVAAVQKRLITQSRLPSSKLALLRAQAQEGLDQGDQSGLVAFWNEFWPEPTHIKLSKQGLTFEVGPHMNFILGGLSGTIWPFSSTSFAISLIVRT